MNEKLEILKAEIKESRQVLIDSVVAIQSVNSRFMMPRDLQDRIEAYDHVLTMIRRIEK